MLPLIEAEEVIDPPPPGFPRPCTTLDLKKAPQPKASQCVSRVKSFLERSRSRSVASAAPFPLSSLSSLPLFSSVPSSVFSSCEWSSSYAPPTHEILPLQISSYAIGPRHCVLRLPPVDCLMCCFVRPVSRTSDASDASSRHAFTPGSVSLAASAAAAVLGTRPAA